MDGPAILGAINSSVLHPTPTPSRVDGMADGPISTPCSWLLMWLIYIPQVVQIMENSTIFNGLTRANSKNSIIHSKQTY